MSAQKKKKFISGGMQRSLSILHIFLFYIVSLMSRLDMKIKLPVGLSYPSDQD